MSSSDYGITKNEATEQLLQAGYDARYEKGAVMVRIPVLEFDKKSKEIKDFVKKIDYRMSFGIIGLIESKETKSKTEENS